MRNRGKTIPPKGEKTGSAKKVAEGKGERSISPKWAARKQRLKDKGYEAKSYEVPTETVALVNAIANKSGQSVGDVVAEAVRAFAVKHGIETNAPKAISLVSLDDKYNKLKDVFSSFVKGYFYNSPGPKDTEKLIKHVKQQARDGINIKTEEFYKMLKTDPVAKSLVHYEEFKAFLFVFELRNRKKRKV